MKNIIILILNVGLFSIQSYAQLPQKINKTNDKNFTFDKKTHHFGTVVMDKEVTTEFIITNTSKTKDLELINVHPTCGCTVSEYTKTPIPPGKTGTIKATFTGLTTGNFKKGIVISTNFSKKTDVLFLTGKVIRPEKKDKQ